MPAFILSTSVLQHEISPTDIDECSQGHNCEEQCVNTPGSFHCACADADFVIASDGQSCVPSCGGRLTNVTGTFSTPGWPDHYRSLDFRCEWIIDINSNNSAIDISFNEPFGIHGRPPCPTDYLEVLDGVGSEAGSLGKFCRIELPGVVETSFNQATVIFQATTATHRPNRVGVSMTYVAVSFDGRQP